jgi:hypothetical protein
VLGTDCCEAKDIALGCEVELRLRWYIGRHESGHSVTLDHDNAVQALFSFDKIVLVKH